MVPAADYLPLESQPAILATVWGFLHQITAPARHAHLLWARDGLTCPTGFLGTYEEADPMPSVAFLFVKRLLLQ